MARSEFEHLKVYRLSEKLADEIWDLVQEWRNLAKDTVGKQVIRSADSIGANIAEDVGRGSFQDNRRFIRLARSSLYETKHWLRRSWQRKLVSQTQVKVLRPIVDELSLRLNAYLKSIGKNCGREGMRDKPTTDNGPRTTD